jgi:Domain of unknown function (DUF4145)
LEQAELEVRQIASPPPDPGQEPTPEETTRYERVAEHSPRAAILEKRAELEQGIRAIAEPYFMRTAAKPGKLTFLTSVRLLRKDGIIDDRTSALLDDLRVIGNRAAHSSDGTEFTKEEAMRFGKLADDTIRYLQIFG